MQEMWHKYINYHTLLSYYILDIWGVRCGTNDFILGIWGVRCGINDFILGIYGVRCINDFILGIGGARSCINDFILGIWGVRCINDFILDTWGILWYKFLSFSQRCGIFVRLVLGINMQASYWLLTMFGH